MVPDEGDMAQARTQVPLESSTRVNACRLCPRCKQKPLHGDPSSRGMSPVPPHPLSHTRHGTGLSVHSCFVSDLPVDVSSAEGFWPLHTQARTVPSPSWPRISTKQMKPTGTERTPVFSQQQNEDRHHSAPHDPCSPGSCLRTAPELPGTSSPRRLLSHLGA